MLNKVYNYEMETLYFIVNLDQASNIMNEAKKFGIIGATTILADGITNNKLLAFFEANRTKREIVFILSEKELLERFIKYLDDKMKISKKKNLIAFTIGLYNAYGLNNSEIKHRETHNKEEESMYNAIFVIVEKGNGEHVVEASNEVGGKGATIINGRGSSNIDTKIFGIDIEPEKEVVLILADDEIADNICENIRKKLEIDEPGKGIIFVQKISKVYGIK